MNNVLDIVLTSIVNNNKIIDLIINDVEAKFKMKMDKEKLTSYLSSLEMEPQDKILMI